MPVADILKTHSDNASINQPHTVPTNDGKTYFTIPLKRRIRRAQGIFPPPNDLDATVEAYVANIEANGGATILRDTTATISNFDDFGNVLASDVTTVGVDLTQHVERT